MNDSHRTTHPETLAVSVGRPPADPDQPLNVPVVLASTYIGGGEVEYGRFGNPTWTAFEDALGALEGGRALVFSSGLSAIAAVLDLVPAGGRVVAPVHTYQGTLTEFAFAGGLDRFTVDLVDITDTAAVVAAIDGSATQQPASMVLFESPTNPALELADIAAICAAARERGALAVVDNTFATPILQQPLADGAHIVVHSATKFISGHSDVVLGAVVTADDDLHDRIRARRAIGGATAGPLEVFLALRGLRTLPLRIERAGQNARALVAALGSHAALAELRYPGFGAIISPVLRSAEAADAFVAAVRLARHATSLGGVETTLERRRRWPSESPSIPEGLVRISVGVEHIDDLVADLSAALDAAL